MEKVARGKKREASGHSRDGESTGGDQALKIKKLTSGNSSQELAGGNSSQELTGGNSSKELAGGNSSKELAGGNNSNELAGGNSTKELAGANSSKELAGGNSSKELAEIHSSQEPDIPPSRSSKPTKISGLKTGCRRSTTEKKSSTEQSAKQA